jgi:hypothetical protein
LSTEREASRSLPQQPSGEALWLSHDSSSLWVVTLSAAFLLKTGARSAGSVGNARDEQFTRKSKGIWSPLMPSACGFRQRAVIIDLLYTQSSAHKAIRQGRSVTRKHSPGQ